MSWLDLDTDLEMQITYALRALRTILIQIFAFIAILFSPVDTTE